LRCRFQSQHHKLLFARDLQDCRDYIHPHKAPISTSKNDSYLQKHKIFTTASDGLTFPFAKLIAKPPRVGKHRLYSRKAVDFTIIKNCVRLNRQLALRQGMKFAQKSKQHYLVFVHLRTVFCIPVATLLGVNFTL